MLIESSLTEFLEFASKNGCYISDSVEFKIDPTSGVGAFLKESIENFDEPLIKVPRSCLLTKSLALEFFNVQECPSSNPNAITQLYLVELMADKSAKWLPYLNILPAIDEISSTLLWKPEELELIRGSDLYVKTKRELSSLLTEWYEVLEALGLSNESTLNFYQAQDLDNIVISSSTERYSFSSYVWASLIFRSRAFPSIIYDANANLNDAFLFPVVDLLNHRNGTKVTWKYQDDFVQFTTFEKIKAGDELFNNYGDKTNEELLIGYGFAMDNNPFDSTTVTFKLSADVISRSRKFRVKLQEENIVNDALTFNISFRDSVPQVLVDLFSFLCKLSSETELTVRSTLEGLDKLDDIFNEKIKIFKVKSKVSGTDVKNPQRIKNIKIYLTSQRKLFQTGSDQIQKIMKSIVKTFKPISFKTFYKSDSSFANSLLLSLGVTRYEDLINKKLTRQALLLWIVKAHNSDLYSKRMDVPSFVKDTYKQVSESISIEKEDVMEYMDFYKSFFPSLAEKIPEIYNVGSWSIKDFVIAGTVIDRIVWIRRINSEPLFFKKQPIKSMNYK